MRPGTPLTPLEALVHRIDSRVQRVTRALSSAIDDAIGGVALLMVYAWVGFVALLWLGLLDDVFHAVVR